ncbi:Heavy metal-associated isoprenylated plant protein 23 [Asimina triloba]
MGMGGTLEYFSGLLSSGHNHKKKKKQLQTVELKVRMDCEGCENKVKKAASSMKGVQSVDVNRKQQKVTVIGYVEANKVLKKVRGTGKKAEFWPYVPYNISTQPYSAQSYDKKAPPGYVRKVEPSAENVAVIRQEEQYTNMFSDDNPNACSIMETQLFSTISMFPGMGMHGFFFLGNISGLRRHIYESKDGVWTELPWRKFLEFFSYLNPAHIVTDIDAQISIVLPVPEIDTPPIGLGKTSRTCSSNQNISSEI